MLAVIADSTLLLLGFVCFVSLAVIASGIMQFLEDRKRRQAKLERQMDGYNLTPQAAEYRRFWFKELRIMIDARCKVVAKEANTRVIDGQIIQRAIMEVAHNEWVRLSERR